MAERPRDACKIPGWVTLRLNFRLKGLSFCDISSMDRYMGELMIIQQLPLKVFTQRNFYSIEIEFYFF